jgi:hypothetical protein
MPSIDLQRICNVLTNLRHSFARLIISAPLSVCPPAFNNISRKFCESVENLCRSFMFHWNLKRKCENGLLTMLCLSVRPSVCVSLWNNSSTTGSVFMKIFKEILKVLSRKFCNHWNLTKITGNLYLNLCTIMITCNAATFKIRIIIDNIIEQFLAHTLGPVTFFWNWYMWWDNVEVYGMTDRREAI